MTAALFTLLASILLPITKEEALESALLRSWRGDPSLFGGRDAIDALRRVSWSKGLTGRAIDGSYAECTLEDEDGELLEIEYLYLYVGGGFTGPTDEGPVFVGCFEPGSDVPIPLCDVLRRLDLDTKGFDTVLGDEFNEAAIGRAEAAQEGGMHVQGRY